MADSPAFEAACVSLETAGSLNRLEARGTVRLALKQAGLDAKCVTARELVTVVQRVLPAQLAARGVEQLEALCSRIAQALAGVVDGVASGDTPEAVFSRLGGS
jgi:hypothetical protein